MVRLGNAFLAGRVGWTPDHVYAGEWKGLEGLEGLERGSLRLPWELFPERKE